jgi:hypothetical protein
MSAVYLTKPGPSLPGVVGTRWSKCHTISVKASYGDTPRGGTPRIVEYEIHNRLTDRKYYRYTLKDARALVGGLLMARPALKWDSAESDGEFLNLTLRSRDGLLVVKGFVGLVREDCPGGMYSVGYTVTFNGKVLRDSQWWTGVEPEAQRVGYLTAYAMASADENARAFGVELLS